jgi:hypothetical protein
MLLTHPLVIACHLPQIVQRKFPISCKTAGNKSQSNGQHSKSCINK